MLGEQVVIDSRLVVEAFEKSRGNQLDQVVITLQRLAQQHQVIAAAPAGRLGVAAILSIAASVRLVAAAIVAAALRDVNFAADDGL